MFNPYYGLFEYSATDNYTLQVLNKSLSFVKSHLVKGEKKVISRHKRRVLRKIRQNHKTY